MVRALELSAQAMGLVIPGFHSASHFVVSNDFVVSNRFVVSNHFAVAI